VQAEAEAPLQVEDGRQGIHRAGRRRADGGDDGPDASPAKARLEGGGVEAAAVVAGHGLEGDGEHAADAAMRVVCLLRGHDGLPRGETSGHPERFQVGQRAAAGQVADVAVPADHPGELRNSLLLHGRARPPAVQGMVVRVDEERQAIGQPRHGVRGLQHLPGVERMKVGVVVPEALGRGLERGGQARGTASLEGRQIVEARPEPRQGFLQEGERLGVETETSGVAHGAPHSGTPAARRPGRKIVPQCPQN
jgi:hypothetical protein